jgi:hypothetical protein
MRLKIIVCSTHGIHDENLSRFFQHFPSLSRNQDHDGNNTPASDDRAGRNFHLPNICTRRQQSFLQLLYFTLIGFFLVVCTDPPMLIILRDNRENSKNINYDFLFLFLENSTKFDGHNRDTIFNCSYNIK